MTEKTHRLTDITSLTIYDVGELESNFQSADSDAIVIDGGEIQDVDGAGLQWLLLCYQRQLIKNGSFSVSPCSETLRDEIKRSGIAELNRL